MSYIKKKVGVGMLFSLNKKWNYVYTIIFVIFAIYLLLNIFTNDLLQTSFDFRALNIYYIALGENELAFSYKFLSGIFSSVLLAFALIFFIFAISETIHNRISYKKYPIIFKDYKSYNYLQYSFSFIFFILSILLVFLNIEIQEFNLIFIFAIFYYKSNINKTFKQLKTNTEDLEKTHELTISLNLRNNIKSVFLLMLFISIFFFGIASYHIVHNWHNGLYPEKLVITKNTEFIKNSKTCREQSYLHCSTADIMAKYKLKEVSLKITDSTILSKLKNNEYKVEVYYNHKSYYFTSTDISFSEQTISVPINAQKVFIVEDFFNFFSFSIYDSVSKNDVRDSITDYHITLQKD